MTRPSGGLQSSASGASEATKTAASAGSSVVLLHNARAASDVRRTARRVPGARLSKRATKPGSGERATADAKRVLLDDGQVAHPPLVPLDELLMRLVAERAKEQEAMRAEILARGPIACLVRAEPLNSYRAGVIDAPDVYTKRYAYSRCRFIFGGRGWVDPVKEAEAAGADFVGAADLARQHGRRELDQYLVSRRVDNRKPAFVDPTLAKGLAVLATEPVSSSRKPATFVR